MNLGHDFQLKASMLAVVADENGRQTAITIPEGSRITAMSEPAADSQYLNVVWEKKSCQVFKVDFEERAEPVKTVREARV
jgi:hypothetical protein